MQNVHFSIIIKVLSIDSGLSDPFSSLDDFAVADHLLDEVIEDAVYE